jgi:hypothetical protein
VKLRDDVFMSRERSIHRRSADEPRDAICPRRSKYAADPRDDHSLEEPEERVAGIARIKARHTPEEAGHEQTRWQQYDATTIAPA